jgi:hypothetical protein
MNYKQLDELRNGLNREVVDGRGTLKEFIIVSDDTEKRDIYFEEYKIHVSVDGKVEPYIHSDDELLRIFAVLEDIDLKKNI